MIDEKGVEIKTDIVIFFVYLRMDCCFQRCAYIDVVPDVVFNIDFFLETFGYRIFKMILVGCNNHVHEECMWKNNFQS